VLLDDPAAANATDDNAMRKTAANDKIRFMVTSLVLGWRKLNESGVPSSATTYLQALSNGLDIINMPSFHERL
jgi:hypothetical protein